MSESKREDKSKKTRNKKAKKTVSKSSKSVEHLSKNIENSDIKMKSLLNQFESLFLEEKKEVSKKNLKKYFKSNLLFVNENGKSFINYKNFTIFFLKMSGINLDQEDENIQKLISELKEENCTDDSTINDLLSNATVDSIKINLITAKITLQFMGEFFFNSFEIIRQAEYVKFQKFLHSLFKLAKSPYRKFRENSCIILGRIFELLFDELISTYQLVTNKENGAAENERNEKENEHNQNLENSSLTLLKNKVEILKQLINAIKENIIFHSSRDFSKNVRINISENICNICKDIRKFEELFKDENMKKLFGFFLSDPNPKIKLNYLQLLHSILENVEKDNQNVLSILLKILKITRDIILNICINAASKIAKEGIKIIQLLANENLLEKKTVQELLPHLFSGDIRIRTLVSQIVKNYIIKIDNNSLSQNTYSQIIKNNINPNDVVMNEDKELEEEKEKEKEITDEMKELKKFSIKEVRSFVQFVLKFSDNEPKLISTLINNFFDIYPFIKNFTLFFEYVDEIIKNLQDKEDLNLILSIFIIIRLSIEKVQLRSDYKMVSMFNEFYLSLNNDFLNIFIEKCAGYIKKFRLPLLNNNKDDFAEIQCKILIEIFSLFEYVKILENNVIRFTSEQIMEILFELKNTFFESSINFASYLYNKSDSSKLFLSNKSNNKNEKDNKNNNLTDPSIENDKNILGKMLEKAISAVNLIFTLDDNGLCMNFANTNFFNDFMYSMDKDSNSFKKIFKQLFNQIILDTELYREINNNSLENILTKNIRLNKEQCINFYIILNQMVYLNTFFKKILPVSEFDYMQFCYFLLKILSNNIIMDKDNTDYSSINFHFILNLTLLNVIDETLLILFNHCCNNPNNTDLIKNYSDLRLFYLDTIFSIAKLPYKILENNNDNGNTKNKCKKLSVSDKYYNNLFLHFKSKCICSFLDFLTYQISDKIAISHLKLEIPEDYQELLTDFIRDNFIIYIIEYNKWVQSIINKNNNTNDLNIPDYQEDKNNNKKDNDDEDEDDNDKEENLRLKNNFCFAKKDSIFKDEFTIKNFCFKLICKKFSRLILINYSIFLYPEIAKTYFCTFYLLKHQGVIENITSYVLDVLIEKEINAYINCIKEYNNKINKQIDNEKKMNINSSNSNSFSKIINMNRTLDISKENLKQKLLENSKINVVFYYLAKACYMLFNNEINLFKSNSISISFEDKVGMIKKFLSLFSKTYKKYKKNVSNDNEENDADDDDNNNKNNSDENKEENEDLIKIDIEEKDKLFYENFILNGISFALETQSKNIDDEKVVDIDNVYFLEFIKMFLKINLFYNDNDLKGITLAFLKLSKKIENTENVNIEHIKFIARFKEFLLKKGNFYIKEEDKLKEGDDIFSDNDEEQDNKDNNDDNDKNKSDNEDLSENEDKKKKKKKKDNNKKALKSSSRSRTKSKNKKKKKDDKEDEKEEDENDKNKSDNEKKEKKKTVKKLNKSDIKSDDDYDNEDKNKNKRKREKSVSQNKNKTNKKNKDNINSDDVKMIDDNEDVKDEVNEDKNKKRKKKKKEIEDVINTDDVNLIDDNEKEDNNIKKKKKKKKIEDVINTDDINLIDNNEKEDKKNTNQKKKKINKKKIIDDSENDNEENDESDRENNVINNKKNIKKSTYKRKRTYNEMIIDESDKKEENIPKSNFAHKRKMKLE